MDILKRVFKKLVIIFASFALFILLLDSYQLDLLIFYISTLIAGSICIIISYLYLRNIFKPLEKISSQITKIKNNDAEEVSEITRQEFEQTFRNLNIILERLQKYEQKLSKQKKVFTRLSNQ